MFQVKVFLLVLSLVAGAHTGWWMHSCCNVTVRSFISFLIVSVFIEEPSSVTVAENYLAVFRCRVSSGLQGWAVGGVFVSSLNNPDFATHSESASDGGPPVHTLSIVGRSVYNGTTVQCFSLSFSGNSNSSIATLQIQGMYNVLPLIMYTL